MTIPDVCQSYQKDRFICNAENTFFTATVFWGTLGPRRVFGANGIYTRSSRSLRNPAASPSLPPSRAR